MAASKNSIYQILFSQYSSPKLKKDTEVTGPITVTLYAASSAKDTDFTATLVDVFPDGYVHMVQEGIVRARYRNPEQAPSLIEPEKIYEYSIDLVATSHVFMKGHQLRVEISSSNFNRFDRNLNTGNPIETDTDMVKAVQTIYHNQEFPSHITLPIIPR
jgi:putative CocE/NonD family hydrolase